MFKIFQKKEKEESNVLIIKKDISSGIPFRWEFEIENKDICEYIKKESKGEKTKEPLCGGKIETIYCFKGIKEGTTKIIFKYKNFADNYISQIEEYKVVVDNQLKIKIDSKEIKNDIL